MIGAALLAASALAQGFDAHGFRLATGDGDLRAPLQFVRAGRVDALQWSLGGVFEYASRPLVFEREVGREILLRDLVVANLSGGFAPVERFRVDLGVPVVLSSIGPGRAVGGPAPGDLRASATIGIVEPAAFGGVGLGLSAALDVPTGEPARWLGAVAPAGTVALSWTAEHDRFTLSWLTGGRVAPNTPPDERPQRTQGGDTAELAIAGSVLVTPVMAVGLEAQTSLPIDPVVRRAIGIPATALGSVRYLLDGGAYVAAGVGTGLSAGAGASPFRAVVGGGVSGRVRTEPLDRDLDGFDDRTDACPGEAEAVNAYRDEDGCPDALPRLVFSARRGDEPAPDAQIVVTGAAASGGSGEVAVSGRPGDEVTAVASAPPCDGGRVDARFPAQGSLEVVVPITPQRATLTVRVRDAAGRPLPMAEARYLVDDEACAPEDRALVDGTGVHRVGAGPLTVFLTAPGYSVHEERLSLRPGQELTVDATLTPTQVALVDGRIELARPDTFLDGTTALGADGYFLLDQVASVLLSTPGRFRVVAFAPPGGKSRSRADVVVEYLVAQGVARDRLEPVAGGTRPAGQEAWVRFEAVVESPP